jgi:SAM-dependent methyltransferase
MVGNVIKGQTMRIESVCKFESIPVVYKPLDSPNNPNGIPDRMPFELGFEMETGRICQVPSIQVEKALFQAYSDGSVIPGIMSKDGIGRQYAEDFLEMFSKHGFPCVDGLEVLEIGCGTGYLLSRLQQLGATVTGIEPGRQSSEVDQNIPIIRDFFPSPSLAGRFDVIIMYLLLEHMSDPTSFLQSLKPYLRNDGLVCVVVPDTGPSLDRGDVSILFTEHYSYFDSTTLRSTCIAAGMGHCSVESSSFSSLLFSFSKFGIVTQSLNAGSPIGSECLGRERAMQFQAKVDLYLHLLRKSFESRRETGRTIGVYVPGRVVNAISLLDVNNRQLRFFDDSPLLHGKYFPGIDCKVEDFSALCASPPDDVVIMSESFGVQIAERVRSNVPASTRVFRVSEFLREYGG